jgi:hypothetical protein
MRHGVFVAAVFSLHTIGGMLGASTSGGGAATSASETSEARQRAAAGRSRHHTREMSHVTDFREVVEAMAPYAPCLGVETMRREVFDQAWSILASSVPTSASGPRVASPGERDHSLRQIRIRE